MIEKIIFWAFKKASGWKTLIGWLALKITEIYPTFPQESFIELSEWAAITLIGIGVIHKADKLIDGVKPPEVN